MTELLSYDEDAEQAVLSVDVIQDFGSSKPYGVHEVHWQIEHYGEPWPICGDELTKRRMK